MGNIEEEIIQAFADVPPPPAWCLVNSREGEEPALLAAEFRAVPDWRSLDKEVLDSAPDGHGTALGFFSDEAFRYYLPAFILADLSAGLERADVVFHLVHGLDSDSARQPINPRRYGARTWADHAAHRFAVFDAGQARAVARYLEVKLAGCQTEAERARISEALAGYWRPRASEAGLPG